MALGHPTRIYSRTRVDGTQELWSYRRYRSTPSFEYGQDPEHISCRLHHHHTSLCYPGSSTRLTSYERLQLIFEHGKIVEIEELR